MATAPMIERLASIPFFAGLAPAHLAVVASCATPVQFAAGSYILLEGQEAQAFYAITDGRVAVTVPTGRDEATTIETLGGGEVLGWSWLVPPHRVAFDALALTPVAGLAFAGAELRQRCEGDAVFGFAILQRVASVYLQRLHATRRRLLESYV